MQSHEIVEGSFTDQQISGPKGPSGYPDFTWPPTPYALSVDTETVGVSGHRADSLSHKPKHRQPRHK